MTLVMRCDDRERLVTYLYDDGSDAERAAVEAHLARCAACAAELAELRAVRASLADWQPPEAALGFRITRDGREAPARSWFPLPAWAQAAAAVLVLGAGAGLANLEIRYDNQGLTMRTGWARLADTSKPSGPVTAPVTTLRTVAVTARDLAVLEDRLRAEIAHSARISAPLPGGAAASSRELLQQVRALVAESEDRQKKELALRLSQVLTDVESQRRADLVRIEQNMGQIEGFTGQEAVRQRELLNYLMRVSQHR
jgi:putative zinc finger protein